MCRGQTAAQREILRTKMNHDPSAAKLVTSDLPNFWKAWAQASAATTAEEKEKIYQTEYLDKGSAGLKDFVQERIESVKNLVAVTEKHRKYFAALKEITPRVLQTEPASTRT
jgi:hypothetical protein